MRSGAKNSWDSRCRKIMTSASKKISKLLIANRGEIAVRVIRACREMSIRSVAVYSDIDKHAPHVRMADEAYWIGAAPSSESYLKIDSIIEVAQKSGASAIHPGYGFLAENSNFAKACQKNSIAFLGPKPETIGLLGDKLKARKIAIECGLPVAPGAEISLGETKRSFEEARKIGYPVLVKAAAGGGGKGMRIAADESELAQAMESASREAKSAFADERIFLEKYLEKPRHIEVQIFGDTHGNYVHLCERECSIQRRYQKLIEESPSPFVTSELREEICSAAVNIARACEYVGAGTVEFLLDKNGKFYFLEVNTRLQVEHPVTEMVTGFDLVREQIRVAEGHKLSFSQSEVKQRGWSIEARISSEDSSNNFLPSSGKITHYREPSGPGVRVDSGIDANSEVSVHYDPLLAKLIVWGADREQAIQRAKRALDEFKISGVNTTVGFAREIIDSAEFKKGDLSTSFIEDYFKNNSRPDFSDEEFRIAAIVAAVLKFRESQTLRPMVLRRHGEESRWKSLIHSDHSRNGWK